MPENLQNAVIAIEDKNFRTEPGINLKGTIGAALNAFTGNRIWARTAVRPRWSSSSSEPDRR